MADRKGMMEIEDVLSSIRRLVAADTRTTPAGPAQADPEAAERLVLTPAQRIDDPDTAMPEPAESAFPADPVRAWDEDSRAEQGAPEEPAEDLEATLAALEAALDDDLSADDLQDRDEVAPEDAAPGDAPQDDLTASEPYGDADLPEDLAAEEATAFDEVPAGDLAALPEMEDLSAPASAAEDVPAPQSADLSEAVADLDGADAEGAGWPLADAGAHEDTADAAPAGRPARRGFIWEGAFEDTEAADLPVAPDGLFAPMADEPASDGDVDGTAVDPFESADAAAASEADEGFGAGGWTMAAEDEASPEAVYAAVDEDEPAAYAPDLPADEDPPAAAPQEDLPEVGEMAPAGLALEAEAVEEDEEEADLAGLGLFDSDQGLPLDEAALRDLVAEIIRDELRGALGARIARNLRELVRQEIARELAARGLSEDT